jgi:hypothetical protein
MNEERKVNKVDANKKGRSQIVPIYRWYDPILKRPWMQKKNLFDLINTLTIFAGYITNIQNSVDFLYTNNKQAENKTQENHTIPSSFEKEKIINRNILK